MERMYVTVVGQDLFKIVEEKLRSVRVKNIKAVNQGMLGNLKTLTYEFDIEEQEVIFLRNRLLDKLAKDNERLMPLYQYENWMRIIVMKPF